MNTVFDFKKEIYKDYPHCEICDSGGMASKDCPNCRNVIIGWYEKKLDMFIQERQNRLHCARAILEDQTRRMQNGDYDND